MSRALISKSFIILFLNILSTPTPNQKPNFWHAIGWLQCDVATPSSYYAHSNRSFHDGWMMDDG